MVARSCYRRTPFVVCLSFVVGLVYLSTGVWTSESPDTKHASRPSAPECKSLTDLFVGIRSLESQAHLPDNKTYDGNSSLCHGAPDHQKCCTRQMEGRLQELASAEVQGIVSDSSANLKTHLASHAALYREQVLSLLSTSKNNTKTVLTSSFKIPVTSVEVTVERLFAELAAYVQPENPVQSGAVKQNLNQFFDAIFPVVFMYFREFNETTEQYRECLATAWKELSPPPFGEVGRRLIQDVTKSMEVARALLEASDLAVEVVNTTRNMPVEEYCSRSLARLLYCSRCSGLEGVRPCRNYCLNVARGCLAHVAEVNIHWNLFVAAIEKVVLSMKVAHDFQDVLNALHSKVFESISHLTENAHKYHLPVITKCGYPVPSTVRPVDGPDATPPTNQSAEQTRHLSLPTPQEFQTQMHRKFSFDIILRTLTSSKGFLNKLPDTVCSSGDFSTSSSSSSPAAAAATSTAAAAAAAADSTTLGTAGAAADSNTCWNGTAINRYMRHVPSLSLTTQVAENPEMQVPEALVPEVVRMIARLSQMTKVLHNRVIPRAVMQSDLIIDGSGFGDFESGSSTFYPNFNGDDEDDDDDDDEFSGGSGSGYPIINVPPSGTGGGTEVSTDTTDFDFDRTSSSSSSSPSSPSSTSSRTSPTTKSPYRTSTQQQPVTVTGAPAARPTTSPTTFSVASGVTAHLALVLVVALQRLLCRLDL